MNKLTSDQKRVIDLLESAAFIDDLTPWIKGHIPQHYKRLSCDMETAKELAIEGAAECHAAFGHSLYFTQSLIAGAILTGKYRRIKAVTTSQYGKSWLLGQIGLILAHRTRQDVYICGTDGGVSEIIMEKLLDHVQTADEEMRVSLLEPADKLEKLRTSASKRKIGFREGGGVKPISLGSSYKDPLQGNAAVGRGGHIFLDEASRVGDDEYAELGRGDFASDDGDEFVFVEISNPHNAGRFWDDLTAEEVPEDTLIVWMDCRTAYEEGRIKSIRQVRNSDFFKNKSTCKRYLLCELEDYSEMSFFPPMQITREEPTQFATWFLGVDSAYKGKDNIRLTLSCMERNGAITLHSSTYILKDNWIDGETGREIVEKILRVIIRYNVMHVCIDIGFGVYIMEGVAQYADRYKFGVTGVNFGAGATKERAKKRHYAALYAENKRAEMHMDVQDLMDREMLKYTPEMADLLERQLNATQAIRKPNGKTAIIPKEQIRQKLGQSPDEMDSAILSIHAIIIHNARKRMYVYQE